MEADILKKDAPRFVRLFKILSNESRLMVLCALNDGEKCVGDLESLVNLSQSALSQHLAKLRLEGIVKTRRAAQTIYYSLKDEKTKKLLNRICEALYP